MGNVERELEFFGDLKIVIAFHKLFSIPCFQVQLRIAYSPVICRIEDEVVSELQRTTVKLVSAANCSGLRRAKPAAESKGWRKPLIKADAKRCLMPV